MNQEKLMAIIQCMTPGEKQVFPAVGADVNRRYNKLSGTAGNAEDVAIAMLALWVASIKGSAAFGERTLQEFLIELEVATGTVLRAVDKSLAEARKAVAWAKKEETNEEEPEEEEEEEEEEDGDDEEEEEEADENEAAGQRAKALLAALTKAAKA